MPKIMLACTMAMAMLATPAFAKPDPISKGHTVWDQMEKWGQTVYRGGATLNRGELSGGYREGSSDPDRPWYNGELEQRPEDTDIVLFGIADGTPVWIFDGRNGQIIRTQDGKRDSVIQVHIKATDNLHNAVNPIIAKARANRLNEASGYQFIVAEEPLIYKGKGVRGYAVGWFKRKPGVASLMPGRDTLYIKTEPQPAASQSQTPTWLPDWFRGGVGWIGVSRGQIDTGLPAGTLAAGWKVGDQMSIGAYGGGGVNLGSPNDLTAHVGGEFSPAPHLFLRGGYRVASVEVPGDGHTFARYEGPEIGIGFRRGVFEAGLYGSRGKYSDVDHRDWQEEALVSLELTLGNPQR